MAPRTIAGDSASEPSVGPLGPEKSVRRFPEADDEISDMMIELQERGWTQASSGSQ